MSPAILDVETNRELGRVKKMIPRERLTAQNRETGRGKGLLCACGRQRVVCFRPRMVESGANFLPTFACAVLSERLEGFR